MLPNAHSLTFNQCFDIINILSPRKARSFIQNHWNKIKINYFNIEYIENYAALLPLVDDREKLDDVLFSLMYNFENVPEMIRKDMFNHLEKCPWKLALSTYRVEDDAREQWLDEQPYPYCQGFFGNPWQMSHDLNLKLQDFFYKTQISSYHEAARLYKTFSDELKENLTHFAESTVKKKLCKQLPNMNEGQLLALLLNPISKKKVTAILDDRDLSSLLPEDDVYLIKNMLEWVNLQQN